MRRTVPWLVAAFIAFLGTIGSSGSARAECPYFVVPPATDAARTAHEVIVGTVIDNVGDQLYDFHLRIDQVLRGPAKVGQLRRFEFLYPGWPLIDVGDGTMIGPCEAIPGWKGSVMALSLDALAPDGKTRYNGASWISGDIPTSRDLPRTTMTEIARVAEMPRTDTVPSRTPNGSRGSSPAPALGLALVAVVTVLALEARRRRSPTAPEGSDLP